VINMGVLPADDAVLSGPHPFFWGVATSAFQLEGGPHADWFAWDPVLAARPEVTQHHRFVREDLHLLKELGVNAYRFSIEWSRIQPEQGSWDLKAIAHYQGIIDFLLKNGIEPVVTLHHFTHPRWFHECSPWHQEASASVFVAYAERLLRSLKGVRYWITFNEPNVLILGGYLQGCMPPGHRSLSLAFKAMGNILRCHGQLYDLLHAASPEARVSLAHNMAAFAPSARWNPLDRLFAKAADAFYNRSLIDAFLSGKLVFRIPGRRVMEEEVPIRGKLDFLGLNYYTRIHIRFNPFRKMQADLRNRDCRGWGLSDMGWEVCPECLEGVLREASRLKVPIFVTENGIATSDDRKKIGFIRDHVDVLRRCRDQGVDIRGYFYWSFMDNYEWLEGFDRRFGLVRVDFDTHMRTPSKAALYYSQLIREGISSGGSA
jgi:beta-glucosidase